MKEYDNIKCRNVQKTRKKTISLLKFIFYVKKESGIVLRKGNTRGQRGISSLSHERSRLFLFVSADLVGSKTDEDL